MAADVYRVSSATPPGRASWFRRLAGYLHTLEHALQWSGVIVAHRTVDGHLWLGAQCVGCDIFHPAMHSSTCRCVGERSVTSPAKEK